MSTTIDKPVSLPAHLEGEFQDLLSKAFFSEPDWLKEKRGKAFDSFCEAGIPTRKNEEYKYTDVKKVFTGNFTAIHNKPFALPSDAEKLFIEKDSIKLVFVNGRLYKNSSQSVKLPKGVVVGSLVTDGLLQHADILKKYLTGKSDALSQLNTALWTDGAFIYVPENIELKNVIEIVHVCTGDQEILISPRHLIIAEKNSSVSIIENTTCSALNSRIIVNSYADIFAGENSKTQFYRLQHGCRNASVISSTHVTQSKNSLFDTNTITLENEWTRNDLSISLNGESCESHLNGLFITNENDHIDNHTSVQHNKPNCQSNQLYKGILDGRSTGVFNGKIFVERDAQKTNAYQSSKNILMSDHANINTKPQLEIYADDVKCSHGSTTGQLNEEALFYLRSRGLGVDSARNLLLYAFANDVLNTIRMESLQNYLAALINKILEK